MSQVGDSCTVCVYVMRFNTCAKPSLVLLALVPQSSDITQADSYAVYLRERPSLFCTMSTGKAVATAGYQSRYAQCRICLDPLQAICSHSASGTTGQDQDSAQETGPDVEARFQRVSHILSLGCSLFLNKLNFNVFGAKLCLLVIRSCGILSSGGSLVVFPSLRIYFWQLVLTGRQG